MKKNISTILLLIFLILSCRNNITDPSEDAIIEEKSVVYSLKDIKEPSERVRWKPGENYEIKWQITENLDYLNITLLKKFKEVFVISESTINNGLFNWSVPEDLAGSHHYRIKISSLNNTSASSTSVEFEILNDEETPQDEE